MAGIVTYNPDINLLVKNIDAIRIQVEQVIIVDNASQNVSELYDIIKKYNILFIKNSQNLGIACALNQIMQYAYTNNFTWVVTLDQDSVSPINLIEKASLLFNSSTVGEIAPLLFDVNSNVFCYMLDKVDGNEFQKVGRCITSGTVTSVLAWKNVGGFDNKLFIDYVDFDYSLKLKKYGYSIIRMNNVILKHRLGSSELVNVFGIFSIRVSNHSSLRKYYICRNLIVFIKRYKKYTNTLIEYMRLLKILFLILLFEDKKAEKILACYKGIMDGIKFVDNKCDLL